MNYLVALPNNLIGEIASYLNPSEVSSLTTTCSLFNKYIKRVPSCIVTMCNKNISIFGFADFNNKDINTSPTISKIYNQGLLNFSGNKSFILKLIKDKKIAFSMISTTLKNDLEVVTAAIECHITNDSDLAQILKNPALQKSKTVTLAGIEKGLIKTFSDIAPSLQQDKDIVLAAISRHVIRELSDIAPSLQQDKDIVLAAISRHVIRELSDIAPSLQQDKDIVLAAISRHVIKELSDIAPSLQQDKDIILFAIKHLSVRDFSEIDLSLQKDEDIIWAAINNHYFITTFSNDLKKNKSFILDVHKKFPAMFYLNEDVINDTQILLNFVEKEFTVSNIEDIENDEELYPLVLSACIKKNAIGPYSEKIKYYSNNNKTILLDFIEKGFVQEYSDIAPALRNDPEILIALIENESLSFSDLKNILKQTHLKSDQAVILAAINKGLIKKYSKIDHSLRNDPEILIALIENENISLLEFKNLLKKDKAIILAAIKNDLIEDFSEIPSSLQENEDIILAATEKGLIEPSSDLSSNSFSDLEEDEDTDLNVST